MAEIEDLQRRITGALERIGKGVEGVSAAPTPDPAEVETLRARIEELEERLAEERLAAEQYEARVTALKAKLEDSDGQLKARLDAQSEATAQVDLELQRLRRANEQLRENNRALRDANTAGVGDEHLINKGMAAELEALNSARAAEVAENRAIMGALEQLLSAGESPDASESRDPQSSDETPNREDA